MQTYPEAVQSEVISRCLAAGRLYLGTGKDYRKLLTPVGGGPTEFTDLGGPFSFLPGSMAGEGVSGQVYPSAVVGWQPFESDWWPSPTFSDMPDEGAGVRKPAFWQSPVQKPGGIRAPRDPLRPGRPDGLPKGSIIQWNNATDTPRGWVVCNATNAALTWGGVMVPNLEGHFIVATGQASHVVALESGETDTNYALGDKGGFTDHGRAGGGLLVNDHATVHANHNFDHSHTVSYTTADAFAAGALSAVTSVEGTSVKNQVLAHDTHDHSDNRPRYYALIYICKVR